jgi:hypothetical protein
MFNISVIIALKIETVRTSETSMYFNVTTRRCNPEGSLLHPNPTFSLNVINNDYVPGFDIKRIFHRKVTRSVGVLSIGLY